MLLCGTSRQGYNLTHTDEKGDGSVPKGRDSLPWRRVCFVYLPSICLLLLAGFVIGRVQTTLNKPEIDCKPEAQHLSPKRLGVYAKLTLRQWIPFRSSSRPTGLSSSVPPNSRTWYGALCTQRTMGFLTTLTKAHGGPPLLASTSCTAWYVYKDYPVISQAHWGCQDTLRRGFYEVYDSREAILRGDNSSYGEESITLHHVLHCIEFLRQSIMCHADSTIEAKDPDFHGVVGFGIAHSCKSWDQLVRWVNSRNGLNTDWGRDRSIPWWVSSNRVHVK